MASIAIKRIYEPAQNSDGIRILVDRLWPRGVAKDKANIDLWLRDIAPSDALRKRFHGKPEAWDEFCSAYFDELKSAPAEAAKTLSERLAKGHVTLLYAARDEQHNNAVALKIWLDRHKTRR